MTYRPGPGTVRLETLDAHAAGEPLRVVTAGWPAIPGATMLAKRRFARAHHDHLRRALMLEPRGHADMYGCVLTEPVTDDGDVGVLFLHNEGYSTMCGHGVIALVTAGLEAELLHPREPGVVRLDTPAGRVTARAELTGGRVSRVAFTNVPAFVLHAGRTVAVEGLGPLEVDVAYGGAFYAYADARGVGLPVEPARCAELVEVGMRIKRAVAAELAVAHPAGPSDLDFLYGAILSQPASGGAALRNVCVFADGEVDRSPTGTGVSGRAAIEVARGRLPLGRWLTVESLIGTRFDVRALRAETVGGVAAVVPEVRGQACVTGRHEFFVDPADPLREGFLLR